MLEAKHLVLHYCCIMLDAVDKVQCLLARIQDASSGGISTEKVS